MHIFGTPIVRVRYMSKQKTITVFDLSTIIDQALSGVDSSTINFRDLALEILNQLVKSGKTHAVYDGTYIPLTEAYLLKKIYKRSSISKSNDQKIIWEDVLFPTELAPTDLINMDLNRAKFKYDNSIINKKYGALLEEYGKLKKILEIKDDVYRPMQAFSIPVKGKQSDNSVAVVLASDWHYEEEITPESVNHLNQYTLSIADNRIKTFFSNTAKMLEKEQRDTKINTMVLALLGDFITGNIHEDNVESSQLGVGEALWAVKTRIHAGIEFLLKNSNVDLIIPCHSGNHGRHTKKQRVANEKNNSLEWLIYKSLSEVWSQNKRVKFMVGDAYHSFIDVFPGYTIRFHHGHNVRYGGGVGGITIPINKAIAQWNRNRAVQLDCMGHFHQYADGGNFVVNSSLIGFSPYAVSIKGAYERPSQSFFLINGKYLEKTCSSKIFLEDK